MIRILTAGFLAWAAFWAPDALPQDLSAAALDQLAGGQSVRVIVRTSEGDNNSETRALARPVSALFAAGDEDFDTSRFGRIVHQFNDPSLVTIDVTYDGLSALIAQDNVVEIIEDRWSMPAALSVTQTTQADRLHDLDIDGTGLTAILFDTGIDLDHPAYAGRLEDGLCFSTPSDGVESLCPGGAAFVAGPEAAAACEDLPECGHGTMSAGLMVGSDGDFSGMAPGAQLLPVQVFSRVNDNEICGGTAPCLRSALSDQMAALDYIRANYADRADEFGVLLMNFYDVHYVGPNECADERDILLSPNNSSNPFHLLPHVAPSGNDGRNLGMIGPACAFRAAISSDANGEMTDFSNSWLRILIRTNGAVVYEWQGYSSIRPRVMTPGVAITSAANGGGYASFTGTSVSAATQAGAYLLVRTLHPLVADNAIEEIFYRHGPQSLDRNTGFPVTELRLVEAVSELDRRFWNGQAVNSETPFFNAFHVLDDLPQSLFAGPPGGEFRALRQPALSIGSGDFPGVSFSSTANWTEFDSSDPMELRIRLTDAADDLPVGRYTATLSAHVSGHRDFLHDVTLLVGNPNDTHASAFDLSGMQFQASGAANFWEGSPEQINLYWRWQVPETGSYFLRAYFEQSIQGQPISIWRGTAPDELEFVQFENYCSNDYLITPVAGNAQRFEAVAGETLYFRFGTDASRGAADRSVSFAVDPFLGDPNHSPAEAIAIAGSPVSHLINGNGEFSRCRVDPILAITTPELEHFWFEYTPDTSGLHTLWLRKTGSRPELDILPRGIIRLFENGNELIGEFDIFSGLSAYFANLQAGRTYNIEVETDAYSEILEIRGPGDWHRPANDNFEDAELVALDGGTLQSDNRFASRQDALADSEDGGHSVWWRFEAPFDGLFRANFSRSQLGARISSAGVQLRVFTGDALETLNEFAISGPESSHFGTLDSDTLLFPISAGETYFIRADGRPFVRPHLWPFGQIVIDYDSAPPPANDDFADAETVSGYPVTMAGSNFGATEEEVEPRIDGFSNFMDQPYEHSVWYRWTSPVTGRIAIWHRSGDIEAEVAMFTGSELSSLQTSMLDVPRLLREFQPTQFDVVEGVQYYFRVSGVRHIMGEFELELDGTPPPNDMQWQAVPLSLDNGPVAETVNTTFATVYEYEPDHVGEPGARSVWYVNQSDPVNNLREQRSFSVNTSGSTFDTRIAVYATDLANVNLMNYRGRFEAVAENDNAVANQGVTSSAVSVSGDDPAFWIAVDGVDGASGQLRLNFGPADQLVPRIGSAVLPYARAGTVGQPVTAFATILNNGFALARACEPALADPSLPIDFEFFPTNPATNEISGGRNEALYIDVGIPATYLISLTPTAAFDGQDIALTYRCTGDDVTARQISGVNSFFLSADLTPPPDLLGIAATIGNTGIMDLGGANRAGFFSTASVNIGSGGTITFSADDGGADLPVTLTVCETDPATGQCLGARSEAVTITMAEDQVRTFAVFARASGDIALSPANNRIFARWTDSGGVVRGATSVAVRTVQ